MYIIAKGNFILFGDGHLQHFMDVWKKILSHLLQNYSIQCF